MSKPPVFPSGIAVPEESILVKIPASWMLIHKSPTGRFSVNILGLFSELQIQSHNVCFVTYILAVCFKSV